MTGGTIPLYKTGPARYEPPYDHVRPLVIGAALCSEFMCIAPAAWNAARVRADLFARYDFRGAGWEIEKTHVIFSGGGDRCLYWCVAKEGTKDGSTDIA